MPVIEDIENLSVKNNIRKTILSGNLLIIGKINPFWTFFSGSEIIFLKNKIAKEFVSFTFRQKKGLSKMKSYLNDGKDFKGCY